MKSMSFRGRIIAGLVALVGAIAWGYTAYATGTMTTQLQLKINTTGYLAVGLTTVDNPITQDYTQLLSSGTGANQASNIYHAQRTLAASATENLDLAGTLTNAFGVTLTFTKIKAIIIHAAAANTNNVQVGGAASNAFVNWVADATDIINIRPGGTLILVAPDSTGYAVTAGSGDILKVTNSAGSTGVTYDVIILGVD